MKGSSARIHSERPGENTRQQDYAPARRRTAPLTMRLAHWDTRASFPWLGLTASRFCSSVAVPSVAECVPGPPAFARRSAGDDLWRSGAGRQSVARARVPGSVPARAPSMLDGARRAAARSPAMQAEQGWICRLRSGRASPSRVPGGERARSMSCAGSAASPRANSSW